MIVERLFYQCCISARPDSEMLNKAFILSALLCALSANAAPAIVEFSKRQSITALTSAQIAAFKPFTHFASTAYCNPSTTINWSCGGMIIEDWSGILLSSWRLFLANCAANPDFIPVASGGDGSSVQFCELFLDRTTTMFAPCGRTNWQTGCRVCRIFALPGFSHSRAPRNRHLADVSYAYDFLQKHLIFLFTARPTRRMPTHSWNPWIPLSSLESVLPLSATMGLQMNKPSTVV